MKDFIIFKDDNSDNNKARQKEIELVGNMNFWQFRKWKKEQRKKDIL